MRKTKKLTNVLKALFLISALCLLTVTQSNAQSVESDTYSTQTIQTAKWETSFGEWNFFQWLIGIVGIDTTGDGNNIVTTDMTRKQKPVSNTPNNTWEAKRVANSNNGFIVTDDMSIRDSGGN